MVVLSESTAILGAMQHRILNVDFGLPEVLVPTLNPPYHQPLSAGTVYECYRFIGNLGDRSLTLEVTGEALKYKILTCSGGPSFWRFWEPHMLACNRTIDDTHLLAGAGTCVGVICYPLLPFFSVFYEIKLEGENLLASAAEFSGAKRRDLPSLTTAVLEYCFGHSMPAGEIREQMEEWLVTNRFGFFKHYRIKDPDVKDVWVEVATRSDGILADIGSEKARALNTIFSEEKYIRIRANLKTNRVGAPYGFTNFWNGLHSGKIAG